LVILPSLSNCFAGTLKDDFVAAFFGMMTNDALLCFQI
jgi:hypothetical protein